MEAILHNGAGVFQRFMEFIDQLTQPTVPHQFPVNYHLIKHVVVNGEVGVLIYDFDQRCEYVVIAKSQ